MRTKERGQRVRCLEEFSSCYGIVVSCVDGDIDEGPADCLEESLALCVYGCHLCGWMLAQVLARYPRIRGTCGWRSPQSKQGKQTR